MYIKERSTGKGTLLFTTDTDRAPNEEWFTVTCCHCNGIFIVRPGSGKKRDWCFMCGASTCGNAPCNPALNGCTPFEKKLEAYERVNRFKSELGYVIGSING
jgi:hypothetical protein